MVAILLAAILGAGFATLFLAKSGVLIVILAIPIAGSVAGMAAALALAVGRERYRRRRTAGAPHAARPFTIVG